MQRLWWRGLASAAVAATATITATAIDPTTFPFIIPPAQAKAKAKTNAPLQQQEDKLKLVQVVFRHGARTPLSKLYWPELVDKWDVCEQLYTPIPVQVVDEDGNGERPVNSHDAEQVATVFAGGCSRGQLTREGQQQARSFGRWLRQRYMMDLKFLPEEYREDAVYGRTTNYSRTVATLQGVLTGLYPTGTDAPITVRTTEEMDEILFGNPDGCRRLKSIIKAAAAAANEALPPPEVRKLADRIRDILGLDLNAPVKFLDLHDTITTMKTHGKPIPPELRDEELLRAIEEQATKRFMTFVVGTTATAASSSGSGTATEDGGVQQNNNKNNKPPELLRLGLGRLMCLLVQRMENAASPSKSPSRTIEPYKMYLYSGHDSTIMPLLAALGQEVDHWPVYLSNIVLELWERPNGDHYVTLLYNREPLEMGAMCGGGRCLLSTLRHTVLGPYLLTKDERQKECLVHFSHDLPAGEHVSEKDVQVGSAVSE